MRIALIIVFIGSALFAECRVTLRKYELTNGTDTCKWSNLYESCESKGKLKFVFHKPKFSGNCAPFKKPMRGVLVSEEPYNIPSLTEQRKNK